MNDDRDVKELFETKLGDMGLHEVKLLPTSSTVQGCLDILANNNWGSLVFGESSSIEGIISEKDLLFKAFLNYKELKDKTVDVIFTERVKKLTVDKTLYDCLAIFKGKDIRHIPIIDNECVRMMSIRDLLRFLFQGLEKQLVEFPIIDRWESKHFRILEEDFHVNLDEIMGLLSNKILYCNAGQIYSTNFVIVDENDSMKRVVELMCEKKTGCAVVMSYETKIVGILTERDFIKDVFPNYSLISPVKNFMTPCPHIFGERHYIGSALRNMFHYRYRNIIVADEEGFPIGLITLLDIIRFMAFILNVKATM
ncbi:CBS domain-containing protein [Halobacteriovorax sp. GB3]|uniref:CBS domain-containing protein n=1 Tax=Halobacteriovorax sp. GB3 TaxID=2719615 RepID=UPI0023608194|nr:CBS domain-containing protein [Halobacteriovorax sp. GB3]MDD0853426.1 CBS domain-containing protein [Halobacteriovorax sp. GB3]